MQKPPQPNKMDFYWNGETTLFLINLPDEKNKFSCDNQLNNNQAANITLPPVTVPDNVVTKMELDLPAQQTEMTLNASHIQNNLSHLPLLDMQKQNNVMPNGVLHTGVMRDSIMPNEVMQQDIKCKFNEMPVYRAKSVFDENIYNDDLSKQVLFDSDASTLGAPFASTNDNFMKTDKIPAEYNIFDHHQDITDMEEDTTSDLRNQIGELKTFDDIELMELIGQQLDMDISDTDDTCAHIQNMPDIKQHQATNSEDKKYFDPFLQMKANKRNLNPSLQPSLNEFIQQQSQNIIKKLNDKNLTANDNLSIINNNNNSNSNNNNNISNNNNNINNNNNSSNNNNSLSNSNNFQMGSMDPDYLDNNLASFEFIPYTSVAQNQQQMSYPQFHCTNGNPLMQSNAIDPIKFHNQDSILDLFSADELKITGDPLSWAEVDYAT